MADREWKRREWLNGALAAVGGLSLDWAALPVAKAAAADADKFDVVVIGSGLGGLSCATAFARQGFKALVLEQHDKAGGYATTFTRAGGFTFDVSLHSTTVSERNKIHNLIPGFPEIQEVEFVPHPYLYRAVFPEHDIRVAQQDLPGYVATLKKRFPQEQEGIQALFNDMTETVRELRRYGAARGKVDMARMPQEYPRLVAWSGKTWGSVMDAQIKDPKLKAVVSALWSYFGLPPSKLSSMYYAVPTVGYLEGGGYYPRGRSQAVSDAFVKYIEGHGGKVLLGARVERILVKNGAASGVKTADGREFEARAVVSNANAFDTFHSMLPAEQQPKEYLVKMETFSTSLSSFIVFLGLKRDLVGGLGIRDSEIFYASGYDPEASYQAALNADLTHGDFGVMLYDNLYDGYSPAGKNILSIITLQGYDHWKPFEADYRKGAKGSYRKEKDRMANLLIQQVEKALLPGLSKAIEVREVATPLTNVKYTGNYRGAIYGWDQTVENSNRRRLGHSTPVANLYLAGAWTSPGGGYSAVISSGLECFSEILAKWG